MITCTIGRFAGSRRSDDECLDAARLIGPPGLLRSASVKRSPLDKLPDLRRYAAASVSYVPTLEPGRSDRQV